MVIQSKELFAYERVILNWSKVFYFLFFIESYFLYIFYSFVFYIYYVVLFSQREMGRCYPGRIIEGQRRISCLYYWPWRRSISWAVQILDGSDVVHAGSDQWTEGTQDHVSLISIFFSQFSHYRYFNIFYSLLPFILNFFMLKQILFSLFYLP